MRDAEELRRQYEIEKELGNRLRRSRREERATLYSQVYDELYRRVPGHPQRARQNTVDDDLRLQSQVRLLRPYLTPDTTFLEIGAGDCALTLRVAPMVHKAYGIEVSEDLTRGLPQSEKFQVLISRDCEVPLPDNTIDLAYSFQVIEHIHPDDVVAQLTDIYRVLKPGGRYYCITPNRLSGPSDISRDFDREATGLHLREYSITDLVRLFRSIGFRRVWIERMIKGRRWPAPLFPATVLEKTIERLPWNLRTALARSFVISRLLNVSVMGEK